MSSERQTRPSRSGRWKVVIVAFAAAAAVIAVGCAAWIRAESTRTVFPLREVPTPDDYDRVAMMVSCGGPAAQVKHYPPFRSAKPLCGNWLAGMRGPDGNVTAGYYFAVDESGGTGSGYDTLYIDANGDLDLTDDKPAKGRQSAGMGVKLVCFGSVEVKGAGEKDLGLAVMPRLLMFPGQPAVDFLPATLRQGQVWIGGREYTVTLARDNPLSAGYDAQHGAVRLQRPYVSIRFGRRTLLRLSQQEDIETTLGTIFLAHGARWSLSTTPAVDEITVHPHREIAVESTGKS
jgi:hypothetical protein